jgi:uncharacterized protein YukE
MPGRHAYTHWKNRREKVDEERRRDMAENADERAEVQAEEKAAKEKLDEASDLLRQLDQQLSHLDAVIGRARREVAAITDVWKNPVAAEVQAMFNDMLKQATGLQDRLGSVAGEAREAVQQAEDAHAQQQRQQQNHREA